MLFATNTANGLQLTTIHAQMNEQTPGGLKLPNRPTMHLANPSQIPVLTTALYSCIEQFLGPREAITGHPGVL